jgi:hypothetical protein
MPLNAGPANNSLIAFVHIPKTGGTTLITMIEDQYSPAETYKIHYNGSRKQVRRLRTALRRQRDTLRIVWGHMDFAWSAFMPPDTRFFTFLRDPVERVISHYYQYRRMQDSPIHALAMRSSLLQWVRDCGIDDMDNGQTRHLAGAMSLPCGEVSPATLEQAKANLASRFVVVGITERFDESQILLHRTFGWPYRRYPKRRVGTNRVQRTEVDAEVLKEIENCNRFDLELYRFASELFEKELGGIDVAGELALLKMAPEYVAPIVHPTRSTPVQRGILSRLKHLIAPD